MAKITAARKAIKKQNKGTLAKASAALRPTPNQTGVAKLRKSIVPGTVLILLAGVHKGKRVIFLKQLASGLLLVTGLMKVNGVPLRRVNQRYVIATSSKVELPQAVVDAANKADDTYFKNIKVNVQKQNAFIAAKPETKFVVNQERVVIQKEIDAALLPVVTGVSPEFVKYLAAKFSIPSGVAPHNLKF